MKGFFLKTRNGRALLFLIVFVSGCFIWGAFHGTHFKRHSENKGGSTWDNWNADYEIEKSMSPGKLMENIPGVSDATGETTIKVAFDFKETSQAYWIMKECLKIVQDSGKPIDLRFHGYCDGFHSLTIYFFYDFEWEGMSIKDINLKTIQDDDFQQAYKFWILPGLDTD